jgi:hypothetical protein
MIYFSLTTLSTIGFGDITPITLQARYAAVAEGITGQFYLAILVATKNSESGEKSRVLRITALMSPACLSSNDLSSLCSPADSVVGQLWN